MWNRPTNHSSSSTTEAALLLRHHHQQQEQRESITVRPGVTLLSQEHILSSFDEHDQDNDQIISTTTTTTVRRTMAKQVKRVKIARTVQILGEGVFEGCRAMTNVELEGLPREEEHAENDTDSDDDEHDTADSSHHHGPLQNETTSTTATTLALTSIQARAFMNCSSLESLDLSGAIHVTVIPIKTFYGCRRVQNLHLPPRLKRLDTEALAGCTALRHLDIPSTLQRIGDFGLWNCGVTHVTIPRATRHIGRWAFRECRHLETITLEAAPVVVTKQERHSPEEERAQHEPEGVTIEDNAFWGSDNVVQVTFPETSSNNPLQPQLLPHIIFQYLHDQGRLGANMGFSPRNRQSCAFSLLAQQVGQIVSHK